MRQIDRETVRAARLAEPPMTAGTRCVACLGELIACKRPTLFIDVVAECVEAHPDVPVMGLIFGVVPGAFLALNRTVLDRVSGRDITDRMTLSGFKSAFAPYTASGGLRVVLSLNEPFGRILIEAVSQGTDVIAIDHGGNSEDIVNRRTGFLVGYEDIGAFARRMHRMISDPAALWQIRGRALADVSGAGKPKPHLRGVIVQSRPLFQRINRRRQANAVQ